MILILILKNAVKITDWLDFLSDTKSEKKIKNIVKSYYENYKVLLLF